MAMTQSQSPNPQSAILHPPSSILGFIQAGGKSARMGVEKAFLEIAGRPMIEHVMAAAASVAGQLAVVIHPGSSQAARYRGLASYWNAELLYDRHDHRGPLGGIHTALLHCQSLAYPGPALILACDLPFMTGEFLTLLHQIHVCEANAREANGREAIAMTLPVDDSGRLQPLAAIYSQSCLLAVEQLLSQNLLRVDGLCALVPARRVLFQEIAHLPGAGRLFFNINNKEEYLAVTEGPLKVC